MDDSRSFDVDFSLMLRGTDLSLVSEHDNLKKGLAKVTQRVSEAMSDLKCRNSSHLRESSKVSRTSIVQQKRLRWN